LKYPLYTILVLATCISLYCCTPSKEFPEHYKGEQIQFGQGGGFSGMITHYSLLDDGRLFQKVARDTNFTFTENWDKPFVKQMFKNFHELGLDKLNHYHPGNLYYFIEYHSPDKPTHRISWGQTGYTPDENVIAFYNLLYRSTKAKS